MILLLLIYIYISYIRLLCWISFLKSGIHSFSGFWNILPTPKTYPTDLQFDLIYAHDIDLWCSQLLVLTEKSQIWFPEMVFSPLLSRISWFLLPVAPLSACCLSIKAEVWMVSEICFKIHLKNMKDRWSKYGKKN